MTVRPPNILAPRLANIWTENPAATLEYEIAQEKASTLGRLGRGLEAALAALAAHDEQSGDAAVRRDLVAQAGYALWLLVVQREALGLRDTRQLMRDYKVPGEVMNRMGLLPAKSERSKSAAKGSR